MNLEIESTHPKITQSGTKALVQGIFRFHNTQQPGKNTRDVEHEHEPLTVSPAEQAIESEAIR
ncbi:hypothetical protein [Actinophytocola sp.]|uniref:hypothetical protein n=1 Tax=Actinophytocola sp. TaxID=1872138 RepID=UPI003D6A4A8A